MFIVKGKLSNYELKKISKELLSYKDRLITSAGLYGQKSSINLNVRKGKTAHPKPDDAPNTYNILQSIIFENYSPIFNFPYTEIPEVQYAYYNKGDFFKKHQDTIHNVDLIRSLTFSLNLSDETSYTGGDLVIYDLKNNESEVYLDREIGSFVIFPSFYFHEAKEVLSGEREALVYWLVQNKNNFNLFKNFVKS